MERFLQFLPSILVLGSIAVVTFFYLKWIVKRFGGNFKSVEWHKKNKWKVSFLVGTPIEYVLAPTAEELIFRAPLIIIFSAISSIAWYGIIASSVAFALMHWFGKKIWIWDILSEREDGNYHSDDVEAEQERLLQEKRRLVKIRRVLQVILTMFLGIIAGYYGIKYQSIWVSAGIHFGWNLVMPLAIALLVFFVILVFSASSFLWDKIRGRRHDAF